MKKITILVTIIISFVLVAPVTAQVADSSNVSWTSGINWDKNSKNQLKKQVSKVMNEKLQEFAEKWTKEFINKPRLDAIDEIEADLITIAKEFHNLYASASAAYVMKEKGYFKKEMIDPFPFDPREEAKKEYKLIGQYLYDQREGFKTYISNGNRTIEAYLEIQSYEVAGGRKMVGGKTISRKYATDIVKRWEAMY